MPALLAILATLALCFAWWTWVTRPRFVSVQSIQGQPTVILVCDPSEPMDTPLPPRQATVRLFPPVSDLLPHLPDWTCPTCGDATCESSHLILGVLPPSACHSCGETDCPGCLCLRCHDGACDGGCHPCVDSQDLCLDCMGPDCIGTCDLEYTPDPSDSGLIIFDSVDMLDSGQVSYHPWILLEETPDVMTLIPQPTIEWRN